MSGLIVAFPYVGEAVGGSHLSSLLLATGLEEHTGGRYRPLIVVHRTGALTDLLDRRGIDWRLLDGPDPLAAAGRAAQALALARHRRRLAAWLTANDVAVVHTNDARIHRLWGIAARAAGLPQLWHQRNAGLSPLMRRIAARADRIVAVSDYARTMLGPRLAATTAVVDNPFAAAQSDAQRETARAAIRDDLEVTPATSVVAFVGHFLARKRPEVFVDIAARVARDVDAVFPMLGGDPEARTDALRTRADTHGIVDRVRLLGFRDDADVWLAGADVVVAPAVDEPFARVVVEAQLAGTPVVAADAGGNPEAIIDGVTGRLVAADDLDGFAAVVREWCIDPVRRNVVADAARDSASQRYSVARHVSEMTQHYDELTGG